MAAPRIPKPSYAFAGAKRDPDQSRRLLDRILRSADGPTVADTAPSDGNTYTRSGSAWVKLSTAVVTALPPT